MSRNRKPSAQQYQDAQETLNSLDFDEILSTTNFSNTTTSLVRAPTLGNSDKDATSPPVSPAEEDGFPEELFNAVLLIIPFSFLLVMMDMIVRMQYSKKATTSEMLERLITGVPILSVVIFYSSRYKATRAMQILFLCSSVGAGVGLIYQLNYANWLTVIQQGPPLATLWVYTVLQLDLILAVAALALIGLWTWLCDVKITF